jgi:hypothetical protein
MQTDRAPARAVTGLAGLWILGTVAVFALAGAAATVDRTAGAAIEALDRGWSERNDAAALDRAIATGTAAFAAYPSSYEIAWRLARLCWRQGDLRTDTAQRRERYDTARRYAETASTLDPSRVEGHCYFALTTGDYGGTISPIAAAIERVAATFEREIRRAYAIDRDFDHGSPMLALGRYYFALPWPLRDLGQSRRYLEELTQRQPDVLLGRLYLADTAHALGDNAAARAELQYVLDHEALRDRTVEEGDIQNDARQRLREWFGEASVSNRAGASHDESGMAGPATPLIGGHGYPQGVGFRAPYP